MGPIEGSAHIVHVNARDFASQLGELQESQRDKRFPKADFNEVLHGHPLPQRTSLNLVLPSSRPHQVWLEDNGIKRMAVKSRKLFSNKANFMLKATIEPTIPKLAMGKENTPKERKKAGSNCTHEN
jgi:hypothetical protein